MHQKKNTNVGWCFLFVFRSLSCPALFVTVNADEVGRIARLEGQARDRIAAVLAGPVAFKLLAITLRSVSSALSV